MAHIIFGTDHLSVGQRFELLKEALNKGHDTVLDTYNGMSFKNTKFTPEQILEKFKGLDFKLVITRKRFPWGETHGEVQFKYSDGDTHYLGYVEMNDDDFEQITGAL